MLIKIFRTFESLNIYFMALKKYIYFWSSPHNLKGKKCSIIGKGASDNRKMKVQFEDGVVIECWTIALRSPEKLRSKQLSFI